MKYDVPAFRPWRKTGDSMMHTTVHQDIDIGYIYGDIVGTYRNIIRAELGPVVDFKYEHINTRIAIAERLIKLPMSLLANPKPILAINVRMDEEFEDHFFQAYNNLTNLAWSVDVDRYTDVFVRCYDDEKLNYNLQMLFSFKQIKLDLELTVVHDFRPKLLTIQNFWKSLHYPNMFKEVPIVLRVPVPDSMVKYYAECHEIDPTDIYEVYKHMKKNSLVICEYKMNTQKGKHEIFFTYRTVMGFKYTYTNFGDGTRKGESLDTFTLTRSVSVYVNIPSIGYIDADRRRYVVRDVDMNLRDISFDLSKCDVEYIPYNWQHLKEAGYDEMVRADISELTNNKLIDVKPILSDTMLEFRQHIIDIGYDLEDYMVLLYYKNKVPYTGNTYVIDTRDLSLVETDFDKSCVYSIGIYVKRDYYNSWLKDRLNAVKGTR
jgi:hypothetical protein